MIPAPDPPAARSCEAITPELRTAILDVALSKESLSLPSRSSPPNTASFSTAHRAVALLKTWALIDVVRRPSGHRSGERFAHGIGAGVIDVGVSDRLPAVALRRGACLPLAEIGVRPIPCQSRSAKYLAEQLVATDRRIAAILSTS